jgi:hypothetical protein
VISGLVITAKIFEPIQQNAFDLVGVILVNILFWGGIVVLWDLFRDDSSIRKFFYNYLIKTHKVNYEDELDKLRGNLLEVQTKRVQFKIEE